MVEALPANGEPPSPTLSEIDDFSELARTASTEIKLPPSPRIASLLRPILGAVGRKRSRQDYLTTSSDPPIFSSDDAPASLENYTDHRSKRSFKGTWWGEKIEQPAAEPIHNGPRKRREFKRTVDSGVWMGSDETDADADIDADIEQALNKLHGPSEGSRDLQGRIWQNSLTWKSSSPVSVRRPTNLSQSSISQREASSQVERCVENGIETVDLSGRALGELDGSTLRPLHYMTIQPPGIQLPGPEAYRPFTSSANLYLANNNLSNLPGEIYKLENLANLSVRNNNLAEILPAIAKLTGLEELNLAVNQLRWLPWEILNLAQHKRKSLRVHPNPFLQINSPNGSPPRSKEKEAVGLPYIVAMTKVAYLDINGLAIRDSPPAPSSLKDYFPTDKSTKWMNRALRECKQPGQVPSLLELVLRKCSEYPQLPDLPSMFLEDSPPQFANLLRHAWIVKESGGQVCSVCERSYIIPRTEWIEWWCMLSHHSGDPVPLLRKGCSWRCTVEFGDDTAKFGNYYVSPEWRECGWKSCTDSESPRDNLRL
ncbi:MAG: hypothetical protein MMC33_007800 [Icmadophila ericetorum]|nr:hypothetical protein [Icmadophila ericetorum]